MKFANTFSGAPLKFKFATPGQVATFSEDAAAPVIGGHGAVYYDGSAGTEYNYWGTVLRLRAGCLDAAVRDDAPVSFFNHDENYLLGSKAANTMTLSLDAKGVQYRTAINTDDPQAMSVYAKVSRGDCRGSSMMFMIAESEFEKQDGALIEWITRISPLYEMGPVVNPAMTAANSAAFSEDEMNRFIARRDAALRALAESERRGRVLSLRRRKFKPFEK